MLKFTHKGHISTFPSDTIDLQKVNIFYFVPPTPVDNPESATGLKQMFKALIFSDCELHLVSLSHDICP